MEKESFKELSYLAGFHLKRPDYNFKAISGKLFNLIGDITQREFDVIEIDSGLIVLKSKDVKFFEFRFEERKIVYQDEVENFEEFQSKSLQILEGWQKLNPSANTLMLGGILRRIQLSKERPQGVYRSLLFDKYFQNLTVAGKHKKVAIHLNYEYERKGNDYNINLNLDEIFEKEYTLECRLDINQIDSDGSKKIDFEKVKNIFDFSKTYYSEEFLKDLKIEQ